MIIFAIIEGIFSARSFISAVKRILSCSSCSTNLDVSYIYTFPVGIEKVLSLGISLKEGWYTSFHSWERSKHSFCKMKRNVRLKYYRTQKHFTFRVNVTQLHIKIIQFCKNLCCDCSKWIQNCKKESQRTQ